MVKHKNRLNQKLMMMKMMIWNNHPIQNLLRRMNLNLMKKNLIVVLFKKMKKKKHITNIWRKIKKKKLLKK